MADEPRWRLNSNDLTPHLLVAIIVGGVAVILIAAYVVIH